MTGVVYGIDFGTSTSAIMVGRSDGSVIAIEDPLLPGTYTIPTSICLGRDGLPSIGTAAERVKRLRPGLYRREFKRDFGDDDPVVLGRHEYLPHELTGLVLGFLREQAAKQVAGEPDRVVIGVPASWERGNRDLMLEAATLAGFAPGAVSLVAEPVAAAAHVFAAHPPLGPRTFFVYDLGGGTFDCCVARDAPGGFAIVGAPGGLGDVGGVAFDRQILAAIRDRFPAESAALLNTAVAGDALLARRLNLADLCEELKIKLSSASLAGDLIPMLGPGLEFDLTRQRFEELIRPLLDETVAESNRLPAGLDLDWSGIDLVVPVGGSTRIPGVGQLLYERTGCRVLLLDHPDTAVVRGAVEVGRAAGRAAPPRVDPATVPAPPGHEAWPELTAIGDREPPRPANPDDATVTVVFGNGGNEVLRVCWLGYDGVPQLYTYLHPGVAYQQPSYPGQIWLVYEPDDSVRGAYLPETESCRVALQ